MFVTRLSSRVSATASASAANLRLSSSSSRVSGALASLTSRVASAAWPGSSNSSTGPTCRALHSCMRLGARCRTRSGAGLVGLASACQPLRLVMPRLHAGLHHRSRVASSSLLGVSPGCTANHHSTCSGCGGAEHSSDGGGHQHQHQQQQHEQPRGRRSTVAHAAAAGNASWDSQQPVQQESAGKQQQECCTDHSHQHSQHEHHHHSHAHNGSHAHSHAHSNGHSHGSHAHSHAHGHAHGHAHSHAHSHAHGHAHGHARNHHHHHHHHGHGHAHGGHGHHHFHSDSSANASNPVLSAVSKTGLFSAAEHLEHSLACTVASIGCFAAALLLPYAAAQSLIPAATAALLAKAALSVTYVLSGLPQLAETIYATVAGKIDTHVLMSLSVLGTLYMGMAQEGALLLLLFRGSHQLEHRLTEKAAGSLQRLFDSVPDRAVVVEVEERSNAPKVATSQEMPASAVRLGQHVLVRPGEQVPLDGIITWGTANLSLQHISGEAQPVKLGPGQEVPAGSLSTDGLLVVRVIAAAEDSTPARIAQLAAEAQATRPQLSRWLDSVGAVWSKAVIGATLLTAVALPFFGVPFLGDRGALYRAMGVLTAGSPCALALVPLAYACAIAAITARGILVKSGSAIDALAACKTIALDKTGTITTGSLNLAEGFVISANPSSSSSSSSSSQDAAAVAAGHSVRAMQGLAELCKRVVAAGASSSSSGGSVGATLGTTTGFGAASSSSSSTRLLDSDNFSFDATQEGGSSSGSGSIAGFDTAALKCAVALSRLSNHPVSRAMVDSAPHVDGDVSVLSFEQVPGAGVQGVCRVGDAPPVHVMFGGADWISSTLTDTALTSSLDTLLQQHHGRPSRATAVLAMAHLLPPSAAGAAPQQQVASSRWDAAPAAAADAAVLLDEGTGAAAGFAQERGVLGGPESAAAASSRWDDAASASLAGSDLAVLDAQLSSSSSSSGSWAAISRTSTTSSSGFTVDSELAQQQQEQHAALQAYGTPGQPSQLALLCFEDVIQAGVPAAVQQLQSGSWSAGGGVGGSGSGSWFGGRRAGEAAKDVVMLTGDNKGVAEAVARAVGISTYEAGLKPEDKLAYVQRAAAAAAAEAAAGSSSKASSDDDVSVRQAAAAAGGAVPRGLLMAGDGINDAPALAAAQVGVAIASTPKDMVAAAADIIVLNGQGITNLPWLFHVADRTHAILRQNLALAVVSVVFATVPTVAGFFPLWLAVTLHEGSTLLVALNSLRLLLESGSTRVAAPPKSSVTGGVGEGAAGGVSA